MVYNPREFRLVFKKSLSPVVFKKNFIFSFQLRNEGVCRILVSVDIADWNIVVHCDVGHVIFFFCSLVAVRVNRV